MRTTLFTEGMKDIKKTGTLFPSSKLLANRLTKPINFSGGLQIVEFGAGTGRVTESILEHMASESKLLCFELSKAFSRLLEEKFGDDSRISIVNDYAQNLPDYLDGKADYIVSTLPLAPMPKEMSREILETAKGCLKDNGLYIQIQYSLNNRRQIKEVFDETKTKFFLLNLPPTFIYIAQK